jgi:hypothetical protein
LIGQESSGMSVVSILFALAMGLIFTAIFAVALRRPGPWSSIVAFFLVIFLAAWAGSLWISPVGPALIGVFWVPLVLVAFIVAALLAVASPRRPPRVETISQVKQEEQARRRAVDVLFWALIASFIVIIGLGYILGAARP